MTMQRWLLLAGLLWAAGSRADIYRCDAGGQLSFSDRPCVAGQVPIELAEPNTLETSSGERALAQQFDADTADVRARKAAADAQLLAISGGGKPAQPRSGPDKRKASSKRAKAGRATKAPKAPAATRSAPDAQRLVPPRPR